jgi:hypothetical protein
MTTLMGTSTFRFTSDAVEDFMSIQVIEGHAQARLPMEVKNDIAGSE